MSYVHNSVADGMGKIGVLVGLSGNNEAFGKQVAMHIAAANPTALNEASLDPAMKLKKKNRSRWTSHARVESQRQLLKK